MTQTLRSIVFAAVLILAGVGTWLVPAKAQAARNDDVLPALLTEVKGLRAAMEQMAAGGTQAQLLVGRLQLQEGRVASMIRRLDTVRDNLATARREYGQLRGSMQMLEADKTPGEPAGADDKQLGDLVLGGLRQQLTAAKGNVDRLAAEEMQLTGDIATEQQRWIAINQRLDELERTLAKR
jgi:hypothetical protein